jgi:dipeptidyl aminopeptidase/acylaminoacyl peptidase
MIDFRRMPGVCVAVALASTVGSVAGAADSERAVRRYLQIAVAPGGALVASVEGDAPPSGSEPQLQELVIRRTDTGTATAIALPCGRVPQCWPGSPTWTPDGKQLAFTVRAPGTHARSIYTVAPDGSRLTKVLSFDGTLIELRYSPGGRLALLATEHASKEVGATQAGASIAGEVGAVPPEQRIATLDAGHLSWQSPPDLYVYDFDWRPDGHGFVGTAAPGDGDNQWWVAKLYAFDGPASPRVLFAPQDPRQQIAQPRVSPDGGSVAVVVGLMSDFGSTGGDVYLVPISGGPASNVTQGVAGSAREIAWNCEGRLLVNLLAGDQSQISELDNSGDRKLRVLWSGQESLEAKPSFSLGCPGPTTATVHESFTEPPEVAVGPIGDWRNLTHANAGMTMPLQARSMTWTSDRFTVQGWLLWPERHADKVPLITIIHGGPASAVTPYFSGPGWQRSLLERGYALFRPNPRGSFGHGESFTTANVRDFGYGDLRDILAGVDAVIRSAPVDANRMGVMGSSYGGFMTMWAVTQTGRFRAAIAGAGISNWISYYGQNGIDQWMIPYFGTTAYDDPYIYSRSSPISYIKSARTPTFVYVGERDIECPVAQTLEFWHALRTQGVPTEMFVYPGEGHGLRDPAHVADLTRRILAWFDEYLR